MKRLAQLIACICMVVAFCGEATIVSKDSYISYEAWGRLGDQLMAYSHAEWLSYKYDMPVLYSPFEYADQLNLITKVIKPSQSTSSYRVIDCRWLNQKLRSKVIYKVPFFSDFVEETHDLFFVDWFDFTFRERMKDRIAPLHPQVIFKPKEDQLSVALHIRTTGGFDPPELKKSFPHKFCDFEFYVDALVSLATIMKNQNFYVSMFTDALNPLELIEQLKSRLQNYHNIIFDDTVYIEGSAHSVLGDFFSLSLYPLLIRSQSSFSYMAARIGQTCLEILPQTIFVKESNSFLYKMRFMRSPYNDEKHPKWIADQVEELYRELIKSSLFE